MHWTIVNFIVLDLSFLQLGPMPPYRRHTLTGWLGQDTIGADTFWGNRSYRSRSWAETGSSGQDTAGVFSMSHFTLRALSADWITLKLTLAVTVMVMVTVLVTITVTGCGNVNSDNNSTVVGNVNGYINGNVNGNVIHRGPQLTSTVQR